MLRPEESPVQFPEVTQSPIQKSAGSSFAPGEKWWKTSAFKIYVCHIFSSSGDRMWGFAVGLYMVILFPDSLLLTAIYGFANCLSCIIFGPYIGGWIDKSQRITAARSSVVVQNSAVVLGAAILTITLSYRSSLKGMWGGHLENILFAVIIVIAIVAELASVANKIALEKDWIVVLAGGDNKQLARLNSTMRTINLTTFILAPIVVGQIIHYASPVAGAIFIAVWNIISALIEYSLLLQIYKIVPELSTKEGVNEGIPFVKITSSSPDSNSNSTPASKVTKSPIMNNNTTMTSVHVMVHGTKGEGEPLPTTPENQTQPMKNSGIHQLGVPSGPKMSLSPAELSPGPGPDFEDVSLMTPVSIHGRFQVTPTTDMNRNMQTGATGSNGPEMKGEEVKGGKFSEDGATGGPMNKCFVACHGFKCYVSHHVRFAGLGLACLYMTVLGFDSITTGFIYSQGVNESFIGILTAIGALFGILGSLSFPILRRKLGKNKTGILGFSLETLSLLFCVGSVFAMGSPFKPEALVDRFEHISGTPTSSYFTKSTYSLQDIWEKEMHIIVLLFGIIVARFGLWIADLSVTQIFQEEVEESQRGVINGVQDSLNKFMDLIKFVLVILLPSPETFGYLIFISWFFVFLGSLCFFIFSRQERKLKKESAARFLVGPDLVERSGE